MATVNGLEDISEIVRPLYVEIIVKLSKSRKDDIDWWVTSFAARNTYVCPLYFRLCQLALMKKRIEDGSSENIVVSSVALKNILSKKYGSSLDISLDNKKRDFNVLIGVLYRYCGAIFHVVSQYLAAKLILKTNKVNIKDKILVDIFLNDNDVKTEYLNDRYYTGLEKYLDRSMSEKLLYTPIHYGVRNYFSYFSNLNKFRNKLVLKEDVLNFKDYIYALLHPFRLKRKTETCEFLDFEISELINETFMESFCNYSSIEGLLRYRFVKNLSKLGLAPDVVIEWFENQEVDHGAIAGWRKFFPKVDVVGYQGFITSKHYLCRYPTKQEYDFNLLPTKVCVIGQCDIKLVKEFFSELKVDVAPAFRFNSIWNDNIRNAGSIKNILVTLPIHEKDSRNIVSLIQEASNILNNNNLQFIIKPHPTWKPYKIKSLSINDTKKIKLVNGNFDDLLKTSSIFVGAASSACVQSVALGIPTVIIGIVNKLVDNPIPDIANKNMWVISYTTNQLVQAINEMLKIINMEHESLISSSVDFKKEQFERVTNELTKDFIS